jgi:hypothetical protein
VYAATLADETKALSLGDLHCWTSETIRTRFHYRQPGLTVVVLRVLKTAAHLITESTEQAGCRSWVPLEVAISPEQEQMVLTEKELLAIANRLGYSGEKFAHEQS